ncbi:MAG: murein biosynthesis integral membrane protein MurJ, partial [Acidobacteriota bacterium]
GLKRFLLMALPLMIGQSVVVLDEQLVRVFGSLAGSGAISWLNYARRIMLVPVGVVAQAAGVASYPFMSELVAKKDFQRFYSTLNTALRNVLTLLIPLSVWMMVVSEPTIRLIFQQGGFDPADTRATADLLRVLLASVFCWGVQQIIGRAFYAMQDTLTPALLGTVTTVASLPVYYVLSNTWQATGVAAASAVSIGLYCLVLSLWWRRRFGPETFRGLGASSFKLVALTMISCVPGVLAVHYAPIENASHPYLSALYEIAVSGVCFGVLFVALSLRFVPSLVEPFLKKAGPIGRRLLR